MNECESIHIHSFIIYLCINKYNVLQQKYRT